MEKYGFVYLWYYRWKKKFYNKEKCMSVKIDEKDETSVGQVNRKLEAFVEIVMKKMLEQTSEIKKLKARVKELEKKG